jgi:Transposase/Transposase IS116/IS110/IS902 family
MLMNIPSQFPYRATVGLDWADQKHDVFVHFANGDSYRRKIDSRPEAIQEWLLELRSACAEGKIAIALEQRRGALFYHLCTHLNWIDLYPINPHSLASFRQTFFSSRAKDDPVDSQLLEELLRTHPERLRSYQPEPTAERKLDQYCRHRRSLRDLATKTELKLISTLKQYFPLAVNLFADVGLKSEIALNFLSRWPTLEELHRAKAQTVRSFFYAHNSRSQSLIEKRLQLIAQAHPVTDDLALIEPLVLTSKCLVTQLRQFNQAISQFDQKIRELFKSHPDHFLFESLPGAGEQLAPRLFAVFGSNRSRWADATDIQKYSGIAPVVERSGKSLWVHRRLARPIFVCQTFHEFAQQSTHRCSWADQFYRRQRQRGKSHHSAIRALAFKWIRIIYACWKANKPYDESFYVQALEKRNFSISTT